MKTITKIEGMPDVESFGISHVTLIDKPSKLAFITGQMGNDENGSFGATFKEQVELAFENISKALAALDLELSHVSKITCYLTEINETHMEDLKAIRKKYFPKNAPASTLVGVSFLVNPKALFEIEAIAVK